MSIIIKYYTFKYVLSSGLFDKISSAFEAKNVVLQMLLNGRQFSHTFLDSIFVIQNYWLIREGVFNDVTYLWVDWNQMVFLRNRFSYLTSLSFTTKLISNIKLISIKIFGQLADCLLLGGRVFPYWCFLKRNFHNGL